LARYDCAVLAHSTWYFASPDRLRRTLARLSDWTDRLYISEWDLVPKEPAQVPHLMAVLFQGAMATLEWAPRWNVQSLLSPDDVMELVKQAGWTIERRLSVASSDLQDAVWEVANCMELAVERLQAQGLLRSLALQEINPRVKQIAQRSLDSFALHCCR
jgi:hypothetical protein